MDQILGAQAWLMSEPKSRIDCIEVSSEMKFRRVTPLDDEVEGHSFFVIRDDLLHPTIGGNKMRKLDAIIPFFKQQQVTDVLTCGGCQSAHTAAVAVTCAEHGMTSHLLLRGEPLATSTGYNLISAMYGNVTYVPRSEYADRGSMLQRHASRIAGARGGAVLWTQSARDHGLPSVEDDNFDDHPQRIVAVLEEGAGNSLALLGLIRLVKWLRSEPLFRACEKVKVVVDSGTGTTAIGLAVGVALLGLEWEVIAIMLADSLEDFERRRKQLVTDFLNRFDLPSESLDHLPLVWCERQEKRRFGTVLKGEIDTCKKIARETGILLDPIYTLAAWEKSLVLSAEKGGCKVVMLHTGGTLGLFGLAQRYPGEI